MDQLQTIALGPDPKQQIANMKQILQRGFPDGLAAVCWPCNKVLTLTIEEAAKHIAYSTWPRCCKDLKMEMVEPSQIPPF